MKKILNFIKNFIILMVVLNIGICVFFIDIIRVRMGVYEIFKF